MLCAHTIRRLKDGSFDQFAEGFMPSDRNPPPGWIRFHMLRSLQNPNEVVANGIYEIVATRSSEG